MYKNHVIAIIYLHVQRAFILNYDLSMRDTNVSYNDHWNVTDKMKSIDIYIYTSFRKQNLYENNKHINKDAYY